MVEAASPGWSQADWTLGLGDAAHLHTIEQSVSTGYSSHLHTHIPEDTSCMAAWSTGPCIIIYKPYNKPASDTTTFF